MLNKGSSCRYKTILFLLLLSLLAPLAYAKPVSANPGLLQWSAIDTPSTLNNIIVSPSEINFIAIGSNDFTFYALDIPDINSSGSLGRLYKSLDGGITWENELSQQIMAAGAFTPVWNIAIAPDDVNLVVAVTDSTGGLVPGGPTNVYISVDGGATWQSTNFPALAAGEFISCIDISITYEGTKHDIAVGTRDGTGNGRVFTKQTTGFSSWVDQGLVSDVVALKFSPTYPSDSSLVVIASDATGTWLHLGTHDTAANITTWDGYGGYPVLLWDPVFAPPNTSPTFAQIVTADLELPSDFSGQDLAFRRYYVNTDALDPINIQFGVYRVDDNIPHRINPPITGRVSSISYFGTYADGTLLAGEVTTDPTLGMVNVWRGTNCTATTLAWLKSDTYKSPTGGGNSGYANAQVAWNIDGTRAYCGTSAACLGIFNPPNGTINCALLAEWPDGYLNSVALDESAFSVSPYSVSYQALLTTYGKELDGNVGNIWNQLSLIDTEIDYLTDVSVLDAVAIGEQLAASDYDVLYLFSANDNAIVTTRFNSMWRSTSDPLGRRWERVLCIASNNLTTILRVKQTSYQDSTRSQAIFFANAGTDEMGYSWNEGQAWQIRNLTTVTDLALGSDKDMYILNNMIVYQYELQNSSWVLIKKVDTQLDSGHTIAVPLKNPGNTAGGTAAMVLVGEAGPPNGLGRIVYVDLSEAIPKGGPPLDKRIPPPVTGDAHVMFDDKFEQNGIIYNAIHDPVGGGGKIYRWIIGSSTSWDELEPLNDDFYGLAQRNDVLYGAWRIPAVPGLINEAGADRTLYPRSPVPPPVEWDYLVAELPVLVHFTREPSSLKITSNGFNSIWAIDNRQYNFDNIEGRLWEYTDNAAKVGPFTTAPPSGSDIPVDPKTGRAEEINFEWRQLSYSTVYELQLAKDIDFHNRVFVNENITPTNQLSPAVYLPAGALIPASGSNIATWANIESGHTYYWRVRARGAITGEQIRSPWSATMYFTVEAGLPTASPYPTVTLFNPKYGSRNVSVTPGFSWSAMPKTAKYEFILAKDAALQDVIVKTNVSTTSYLYDGKLDYGTTYFWQVRAIEPVVSDPSPVGTFVVMAKLEPGTPEVATPAPIPSWVWWIIALVTILIALMIAYAMVKPSYGRTGGGKLFKLEPPVKKPVESVLDKPKNPIARIWDSIVMSMRRRRSLKNHGDKETDYGKDKLI